MDFEAEAGQHRGAVLRHDRDPGHRRRGRRVLRAGHSLAQSRRRRALYANQYVLLRDAESPSHSALGRYDKTQNKLVQLKKIRDGVWGIRPRNKEQHCALDLLMTDDIKLITLVGKAGTGKTMLAMAAGLQKVVEENTYSKLLVSRPIFPLGRDVGYLPGDLEQKLNPWMQPIYDNVEFLMGLSKPERKRRAAATTS